jgi:hypothetical protein
MTLSQRAVGYLAVTKKSGGVLLSQGLTSQVPSALTGLTSVFGMGTGMTLTLSPPKLLSMSLTRPRCLKRHRWRQRRRVESVDSSLFRTP